MTVVEPPAPALTRRRYNETLQLSRRYLKFNLHKLLDAAVAAISCEGARYFTSLLFLPIKIEANFVGQAPEFTNVAKGSTIRHIS